MRAISWILPLLAVACGVDGAAATDLLCRSCTSDAECGGNPCYVDVSSNRFCGRPCGGGCPSGYSCQPVLGTSGHVVKSCFPVSESCVGSGAADLSAIGSTDLAGVVKPPDLRARDLALPPCTPPSGGTVTTSGGTVDRLFFGYTGDTRPANEIKSYPASLQMIINNIFTRMAQNGVEFAIDGGDHMEAGNSAEATGNMASYATAVSNLGKPVFMTMGNHECSKSLTAGTSCGFAGAATSDPKMAPYVTALGQISGQTSPYYRFDVMTQSGKATFIVVADDAWNDTQQTWLTQQLTDADTNSKYTFVIKHHPDGNTDQTYFQTIYNLVQTHRYTLFLTGHSHEYKRQYNDARAVVMGLGGAPFDNPNQMWWGYLTVMQCPDDFINVTVYDQATGDAQDTFRVPPQ